MVICKECGGDNREGLSHCRSCGAELEKTMSDQALQKRKMFFLLTLCAAVLLVGVILLTCLLSPTGYERDAKRFVKAVLENDMQTVQELMVPSVYDYAGSSLDVGQSVDSYRVRLEGSQQMGSVTLLEYNQLLINLGSQRKMTEAYYVTVTYHGKEDGQELDNEFKVIMGKIGDEWYVVSLELS